jgi:alanine racemase
MASLRYRAADASPDKLKAGDEVIVYSNVAADRNSIASISQDHGLFSYNLLTALSADIRRILVI